MAADREWRMATAVLKAKEVVLPSWSYQISFCQYLFLPHWRIEYCQDSFLPYWRIEYCQDLFLPDWRIEYCHPIRRRGPRRREVFFTGRPDRGTGGLEWTGSWDIPFWVGLDTC